MKRFFAIALLILLPINVAFATPVSWDGNTSTNILQPLQAFWTSLVKASYFQATSTTATSTFPILQATNRFLGANLSDCDSASSAVTWDASTWKFGCNSISVSATTPYDMATTSGLSISQVAYITKVGGITTIGGVATGTLAVPTGLTITGNRYVLGGSATIALDTGYVIPLQATLDAKALAATTLTIAGTANQVSSSAGAQDLSANRTWTLSLPNHVIFPGSFFSPLASTTNATTTNFHITGTTVGELAVTATGKVYSTATTTAGTGLTYTGTAFNVNTSQNIATLSNLTTNGVLTTTGGVGTLTVDASGLDVANGGTGATTLTGILIGNGTSAFTADAIPLNIANGGTNATSFGTTNGISAFDGTSLVNYAGYTLTSTLLTATNASTTKFSAIATGAEGAATSTHIKPGAEIFGMLGLGGTATTTLRGNTATSTFSSFISAVGANLTTYLEAANAYVSTLLRIPNTASLAVAIAGAVGVDTTSEQFRWYGGATNGEQVALRTWEPSLIVASTTPDATFTDYRTATTTLDIGGRLRALTLTHIYCQSTNNTALVTVGDGTASTTHLFCTPTGASATSLSNNTFISRERIYVAVGSATTTDPNSVTVTLSFKETAD